MGCGGAAVDCGGLGGGVFDGEPVVVEEFAAHAVLEHDGFGFGGCVYACCAGWVAYISFAVSLAQGCAVIELRGRFWDGCDAFRPRKAPRE